jgi:hypothetical protein
MTLMVRGTTPHSRDTLRPRCLQIHSAPKQKRAPATQFVPDEGAQHNERP